MDLLQFLLSFILKEFGGEQLLPIVSALKDSGFDLKTLLSHLTPDMVAPFIENIITNKNQPCNQNSSVQGYGLSAIADIADKDIVYTLNKYFYSC